MRYLILILLLSAFGFSAAALDAREVIRKMQAVYSKENRMEYNSTYELYKGHKSTVVETSYNGYVYRDRSEVYQKIDQTEFVYTSGYFLKINHSQKAMMLAKAQQHMNLDVDMEQSLKQCSSVSVETVRDHYQVTLLFKGTATSPFSVVKLRIDTKTYCLLQLDLYYTAQTDFSEDSRKPDLAQSHLSIKFRDIKINPKSREQLFALSTYIQTSHNLLSPANSCAGYQLIDNRQ